MNNLREIRGRLRSVGNIKKITDAMERVAAARLRRAQAKVEAAKPYIVKMREIVENLASSGMEHALLEKRKIERVGVVVIAADKGLSGSYNGNLLAAADKFLRENRAREVELVLFGKKAEEYYKKKDWKIRYKLLDWSGKISSSTSKEISDKLIHWFLSEELDEVWLIYTQYINVMTRKIIVEKFLPFEKKIASNQSPSHYIFEPDAKEIFAEILPRYCATLFNAALNEAYASELGARVMAMQAASKNSEEMAEKLTLLKNKIRQAGITREIIEISNGAEGLK